MCPGHGQVGAGLRRVSRDHRSWSGRRRDGTVSGEDLAAAAQHGTGPVGGSRGGDWAGLVKVAGVAPTELQEQGSDSQSQLTNYLTSIVLD